MEKKMWLKRLAVLAAAGLMAAAIPQDAEAAKRSARKAKKEKVDICHRTGNGSYHLINISEYGVPAHRRHGDGLPGDPHPEYPGMVFSAECEPETPTPIVAPGFSDLTQEGSLRFRQQNPGNEIYLGKADLGVGANRVEAGRGWAPDSYFFTFAYDGVGNISVSMDTIFLTYPISPSCSGGSWDTLDILVVDRDGTTGVALENVELEGFSLGDFGPFDVPGTFGFKNWTVTAFDFSQPWTLTGELRVEGFQGSAEKNKVQLTVGCLP